MEHNENAFICPPCGESVAGATKEGQNKNKALWPLLPRLTAVLPQSGKTNLITLLWHYVPLPPHRGEDEVVINSLPQGREITARGFTLIELLVVVLIIGILSAVAVPQYRMATDKTIIMSLLPMLKSVHEAQELYYLENGQYALNWTQLNMSLPGTLSKYGKMEKALLTLPDGTEIRLVRNDHTWTPTVGNAVDVRHPKLPSMAFSQFFNHQADSTLPAGKAACFSRVPPGSSDYPAKLCRKVTGRKNGVGLGGYWVRYSW